MPYEITYISNFKCILYVNNYIIFYRYVLTFARKSHNTGNKSTDVSVNCLQLPEWVPSYEAGYSLDRWRNKKTKLKARTTKVKIIDLPEITETTSSTNETPKDDTDDLEIQNLDGNFSESDLNSDIEELFRRSQRYEEPEEDRYDKGKKDKHQRHRRKKRRSRRTIRYSLSKPVSPETEQIIRVNVTSSVHIDEIEESSTKSKTNK